MRWRRPKNELCSVCSGRERTIIDMESASKIPESSGSPWVLYTHSCKFKSIQILCTLNSNETHLTCIDALQGKDIVGSSHGWFILQHNYLPFKNMFSLWNPVTSALINLPPINTPSFTKNPKISTCILTANPTNKNRPCIVLIFCDRYVFMYKYTPSSKTSDDWVSQRLEHNGTKAKILEVVMTDNGVIYAVARIALGPGSGIMDFLVTLHVSDTELSVSIGSLRLKCPFPDWNCFPAYDKFLNSIIESCGLVYMIGIYMSISLVNERIVGVKVWELDLKTTTWVEVDSIGDRTFFFNDTNGSGWCWSTNETGATTVKPNSVYFFGPHKKRQDVCIQIT